MKDFQIVHDCPVCGEWWVHPIGTDADTQEKFEQFKKYGSNLPPIRVGMPPNSIEALRDLLHHLQYSISVCGKCGNIYDPRTRAQLVEFKEWWAKHKKDEEVKE